MKFKFKHIDESGASTGLFSKKGELLEDRLVLDDEPIPVAAIHKAHRAFGTLVLATADDQDQMVDVAFAVTSGDAEELCAQINAASSKHLVAHERQEATKDPGALARWRQVQCPHCASALNLSDWAPTPQCYCPYCEAMVTLEGSVTKDEKSYKICHSCGYYAAPQEFSIFYFYFLLVVYGFSHSKTYICGACMRPKAWKMLAGNALFLLGVPVALWQLFRAYGVEDNKGYPGLDAANVHAKKGRLNRALLEFEQVENLAKTAGAPGSAGICYNRGLAVMEHATIQDQESHLRHAATHFQDALTLCSNHQPSFRALVQCYEQLGDDPSLEQLFASWGAYGTETDGVVNAQDGTW